MPGGYLINQGADCLISVTNNSDEALYNLEVYDHENGDISGMLIAVIPTLLPHKTEGIPYTMWVTEMDASKGKMTNYATVDWTDPATGETQTFTSNEIEIDTKEGVYGGVTVAKSIVLPDPQENMGAQLLKEVAIKTNEGAGDGTTTAAVLCQAMLKEAFKNLEAGAEPMALRRGMRAGASRAR